MSAIVKMLRLRLTVPSSSSTLHWQTDVLHFLLAAFLVWLDIGQVLLSQKIPLSVTAYDRHIEVNWSRLAVPASKNVLLLRSRDGGKTYETATQGTGERYLDWVGATANRWYVAQVLADDSSIQLTSDTLQATTRDFDDEAFMDMVQAYTFRYFWEYGHPVSGMARERFQSDDVVTSGGTGFGIMALLVGIERGYISREQGSDRMLRLVSFLEIADRFKGALPHWLDGRTGRVIPFSQYDNGGDIVETAFLLEGLLTAREYFDGSDAKESGIRQSITSLWEAMDWNWYRQQVNNFLYWHWSPNYAWRMNFSVRGFNEAMMVYLLAAASPTHKVPPSLYNTGWAGTGYADGNSYYGYRLDVGPYRGGPLFFAHYSFIGFDPRYWRDRYTNYFVRNRHHSLINRAYCIENPKRYTGYSADCWGLTASDDPWGYSAHEPVSDRDNGTITPSAALSSMPYTPQESMAALRHFYRQYGSQLWGQYGFYDAFNPSRNWFARSYLAIDQGPIICMIENNRTGLLWRYFMKNPEIEVALRAIGFVPDSSLVQAEEIPLSGNDMGLSPNPASDAVVATFSLPQASWVQLELFDNFGRKVGRGGRLFFPEGRQQWQLDVSDLRPGLYTVRLSAKNQSWQHRLLKL
jgi:hypothetical protein